jgi:Flp pilus assembly protein TadG
MNQLLRRARRGSSAVEFSILLPIMTTILLGTMEFGSWYGALARANFVARDVGRYAANLPVDDREDLARDFATNILGIYEIDCRAYCDVDVSFVTMSQGDVVNVVVNAGYKPISRFLGPMTPTYIVGRASFPVVYRTIPDAF